MGVELTIEEPAWGGIAFDVIADRALAAAFKEMGLDAEFCELSLLACADAAIADLNAEFRGKPVATNVLSWPAYELGPEVEGGVPARPKADPTGEIVLGDIAIAYQTCAREAAAAGKPLEAHVSHLIIHGFLHLLGFDHIRDGDAARMEALEAKILGTMGFDDPYRE